MIPIYKQGPHHTIKVLSVWSATHTASTNAAGVDIATLKGSALHSNAGLLEYIQTMRRR